MKLTIFKSAAVRGILALSFGANFVMGVAHADERYDRHEPYRSGHLVYDERHNHRHYYPEVGFRVGILPPGYLKLEFGGRHLFFHAGVWYEPGPRGYVVVRPPFGAALPILPPDYSTVMIAGVPYYYANDTYYTATQSGYVVAAPPAAGTYIEAPAAPPSAPAPQLAPSPAPTAAPQGSGGTWYYCDAAKAYYPYVATCAAGWRTVPAAPPPTR